MSQDVPPVYLRAAVMIGAVALLAGVAGLFVLPDPPDPARVVLSPTDVLPSGGRLEVLAEWSDGKGSVFEARGRRGSDGAWLFAVPPEGRVVTLVVREQTGNGARVVKRSDAVLTSGGVVRLRVP